MSYSSRDLPNITTLKSTLEGTGVEVFVAEDAVAPGEKFPERISKEIAECDLFVLAWSEHARESEWVQQEIGKAHEKAKPILPLLFATTPALPGFIRDLDFIDCRQNVPEAIEKARQFILGEFKKKSEHEAEAARRRKSEEDARALFVLGGLALWLFSR